MTLTPRGCRLVPLRVILTWPQLNLKRSLLDPSVVDTYYARRGGWRGARVIIVSRKPERSDDADDGPNTRGS